MTKKKVDHKKEAKNRLTRAEKVLAIENAKKTNYRAEAENSYTDLVKAELKARGVTEQMLANSTPQERKEIIEQAQAIVDGSYRGYSMYARDNLDEITAKDGQIDKGLAKLVAHEGMNQLLAGVKEDEARLVAKYSQARLYDTIAQDGRVSGENADEIKANLKRAGIRGFYEKHLANYTKQSHPRDIAEAMAGLSAFADGKKEGDAETVKRGAKAVAKEIKADIEKQFGKSYETKVAEIVRDRLRVGLESSNPKLESSASTALGSYLLGHEIGSKTYNDLYSTD